MVQTEWPCTRNTKIIQPQDIKENYMTLTELEQIFKSQTTADANFTPKDTITYETIFSGDKSIVTIPIAEMASLVKKLEGYEHDAFRDRIPVFIKPTPEY